MAGPASSIPTAYHFTSFYHSHLLLPPKGPACHCGRSRLIFLFYPSHHSVSLFSLSLSLFSCRPARAGRHGRSKVILLTLFQLRSTSDLTGFSALREVPVSPDCLAVPRLPVPCHYDWLRRLAVLRFYVFGGGHGSLLRPCRVLPAVQDHLSGFWEDSETFCRDRPRFTAALFTKSRVVKLRLRSPLSGIANCFTRMFKLTTFC